MCPKMTHVIFDDFAGEIVCRICGIVIESHTSQRSTASIFEISIPATCRYNSFHKTLPILKQMLSQINSTDLIVQAAFRIGIDMAKKKVPVKYSQKVHAAYLVYMSCRTCGRIVRPNYLAKTFNISKKQLKNTILSSPYDAPITLSQRDVVIKLLSKTCNELEMHCKMDSMIIKYDMLEQQLLFVGRNPHTVAAYLLHSVINLNSLKITYAQILSSLNVNSSSVWRLSKYIDENKNKKI